MKCPKCGGEMEKGLMITAGPILGVRWWKEQKVGFFGIITKNQPKIFAHSCSKCGFIENYVDRQKLV